MYEKMIDFVIKNRSMQFAQYAGTTIQQQQQAFFPKQVGVG